MSGKKRTCKNKLISEDAPKDSSIPNASASHELPRSDESAERLTQLKASNKTFVADVNREIDALLLKLKENALNRSGNQIHMVHCLVRLAVNAASFVEALYSESENKPMIGYVACYWPRFATTFNFELPTALRDKPRAFESSGDKMRRELTKVWQERTPLPAGGKTEFDYLRLAMNGFVRAVDCPSPTRNHAAAKIRWNVLDWYTESQGSTPVDQITRADLKLPKNRRDANLWAKYFVVWYQARHPWPSLDRQGRAIITVKRDHLCDPIHRMAFDRLTSLRKSNTKEQSPWNALRAIVRERFRDAFALVKVEAK